MLHARLRRHFVSAVTFASAITLISPGWSQTPSREGNESNFRDWQPTRGQVSTEEGAAGIRPSQAQRNKEDQELQQIDQSLMRQEQPASSAQSTAPK
jgi:hypothetical protein